MLCWVTVFLLRIRIFISKEEERREIERQPALSATAPPPPDVRIL